MKSSQSTSKSTMTISSKREIFVTSIELALSSNSNGFFLLACSLSFSLGQSLLTKEVLLIQSTHTSIQWLSSSALSSFISRCSHSLTMLLIDSTTLDFIHRSLKESLTHLSFVWWTSFQLLALNLSVLSALPHKLMSNSLSLDTLHLAAFLKLMSYTTTLSTQPWRLSLKRSSISFQSFTKSQSWRSTTRRSDVAPSSTSQWPGYSSNSTNCSISISSPTWSLLSSSLLRRHTRTMSRITMTLQMFDSFHAVYSLFK